MYLLELVVVMRRRWYLLVAAIVCTVGVGFLTVQAVPPTYTAQGQVLLLPPQTSVPKGQNPYLSLGGLTPAGDVLAKALSAPETVQRIESQGGSGTYVVELDVNSPAPIISITADGASEAESLQTLALVSAELVPTLVRVQRDAQVPASAGIRSTVLTSPTSADRVIKGPLRALIAVTGATFVVLVLMIAAIDGMLRRPRRRNEKDRTGHVEHHNAVDPTERPSESPRNGQAIKGRPTTGQPTKGRPEKGNQQSPSSRRTG